MVSALVKVGRPEFGLKEQDAPAGSPALQERPTDEECPPSRVTEIELDPELPWTIVIPPEFAIEKSNI